MAQLFGNIESLEKNLDEKINWMEIVTEDLEKKAEASVNQLKQKKEVMNEMFDNLIKDAEDELQEVHSIERN